MNRDARGFSMMESSVPRVCGDEPQAGGHRCWWCTPRNYGRCYALGNRWKRPAWAITPLTVLTVNGLWSDATRLRGASSKRWRVRWGSKMRRDRLEVVVFYGAAFLASILVPLMFYVFVESIAILAGLK